jgi:hypothetical protein
MVENIQPVNLHRILFDRIPHYVDTESGLDDDATIALPKKITGC